MRRFKTRTGAEYRRSTTSSDEIITRLSTLVHLNGMTDYAEGFVNISQVTVRFPA